ncbi:MAG TPA: ATP-binding cassette domain-containing protein [Actinomycetota bacterium]
MATVRFEGAAKRFGDVVALEELVLEVADGELMVLVGPSGSGKTTALRLLAGLDSLSAGHIWIGDRRVDGLAPRDRDIAMVFQDYALYPQMSVEQNLAFALRTRRLPRADIDARVRRTADLLGLGELLSRKPRELSGGQRQRVALGRALVREPQVFLMDEPLSNLDAKLRVQMRMEIARIQRDLRVTTVFVTHDQTEAMTLGDRVAVMRDGRLQQVGTPKALYARPANLFVASFIGSPAINLVEAALSARGGSLVAAFGGHELPVEDRAGLRPFVGRSVIVGVRPEDLRPAAPGASGRLEVVVDLVEDLGAEVYAYFALDAPPVRVEEPGRPWEGPGRCTFVARMDGVAPAKGARVTVGVERASLLFFDPETAAAIEG